MIRGTPNSGKSTKTANAIQNPVSKVTVKARSAPKQSVLGVSNISVSLRNTKKTADNTRETLVTVPAELEVRKYEKAVQVDEADIIESFKESEDMPIIIRPSARVLQEIENNRKIRKQQLLKARLSETRKFEDHAVKQEIHLDNLREFLDTGAITRKRQPVENTVPMTALDEEYMKFSAERTKAAREAYDRIKRKEDELVEMFNSIK